MAAPTAVPDEIPLDGTTLRTLHPNQLPSLIFGAGALNSSYNSESYLETDGPLRTVALALRYARSAPSQQTDLTISQVWDSSV